MQQWITTKCQMERTARFIKIWTQIFGSGSVPGVFDKGAHVWEHAEHRKREHDVAGSCEWPLGNKSADKLETDQWTNKKYGATE